MSTEHLSPDQFHPNVDHYRDGGMGGVGEDRSVVGMVPTHVVAKYREHDGYWGSRDGRYGQDEADYHHEVISGIANDIKAGKGITNPLTLEYDHTRNWASLGEGNHRLAAAEAAGVSHVPVRVVRSNLGHEQGNSTGAPAHLLNPDQWSRPGYAYVPTDMHPSHFNFGE